MKMFMAQNNPKSSNYSGSNSTKYSIGLRSLKVS